MGAAGVILVGQLWTRGLMLPARGTAAPLVEALNQILIFLPILLVPIVRRQGISTMLLPKDRVLTRMLVGLALAFLALTVYSAIRPGSRGPLEMAAAIVRLQHVDEAVQVLMEDLAIGILLFRFSAAVSRRWVIVLVAGLFVVGHVPALLSAGASVAELSSLGLDFGLGLLLLGTILRSGDVLWFWPIHTVMDLTQFTRVSGL